MHIVPFHFQHAYSEIKDFIKILEAYHDVIKYPQKFSQEVEESQNKRNMFKTLELSKNKVLDNEVLEITCG